MPNARIVKIVAGCLALAVMACSGADGQEQAEVHYDAGVELQENGQLSEAIAEYDLAIESQPALTSAYMNRGVAYKDLGETERAIQEWAETIRGETLAETIESSETVPADGAREVKTGSVTIQVWIATTE